MSLEYSYLGRGWSFPPSFTPPVYKTNNETDEPELADPGGVAMVGGLTDIEQSLLILFSTRLGERILAHDYGSDLDTSVFEALTPATTAQIQLLVQNAVLYHEPRINLLNVEVTTDEEQPNLLLIMMEFKVRSTNSRHNYVYPFYIQEGSELSKSAGGS